MGRKRSGRKKNSAIVSVLVVVALLLVLALVIGVLINIIGKDAIEQLASSDTISSEVISSDIASDVSSEDNSSVTPVNTTYVDSNEKICYLTFDDGPSENTPAILKILKEHNATATFFVTGPASNVYHEYLTQIVNEGHTVALHAYNHEYNELYSSEEYYFNDLYKLQDLVYNWTGVKSYVMRFPGGSSNGVSKKYCPGIMTKLVKDVQEKGFNYIDWNSDSNDATGHNVPVETIMSHVKSECTQKQTCLLMHDLGSYKQTTVDALPQIIEYLRSQGYTFKGLTTESNGFHHSKLNN